MNSLEPAVHSVQTYLMDFGVVNYIICQGLTNRHRQVTLNQ